MDELVNYDIMYPNPSSAWANAPHILPNDGLAEWLFSIARKPVNKFSIPFQFPMTVIDHELQKAANSCCYGDVDFSHSSCRLVLDQ